MRKLVSESLNEYMDNFERGLYPKKAIGIGVWSKLTDLLDDPNFPRALENYLQEDRDETVPMWNSALESVQGNWEFIGDTYFLEDFPEILELVNQLVNMADPANITKGEAVPTEIPEWFEEEAANGELVSPYKIYHSKILLLGGEEPYSVYINK